MKNREQLFSVLALPQIRRTKQRSTEQTVDYHCSGFLLSYLGDGEKMRSHVTCARLTFAVEQT
jgi:hypothetical protein